MNVTLTHFGEPFKNEDGTANMHSGPIDDCPDPICRSRAEDE